VNLFLRKIFKRASLITIANVYLVILAGGVVRCTGSGMGCPDWPRCFGRWIPPTEISELPSNFEELYSKGGTLSVEFNITKTWTEYVNRLLGVLVGFAIFITLVSSFGFWQSNRSIFYYSLAAFLLVGFQGWLGAKVVDSNLKPIIITIHMLFALVIVALLIKALAIFSSSSAESLKFPIRLKWISFWTCIVVLLQVMIGTQVRQSVDVQAVLGGNRVDWLDQIGLVFKLHSIVAYVVVGLVGYLIYHLYKQKVFSLIMWSLAICILVEYLGGIFMYRFGIPAFMQPIHLLVASVLFGLSFYLFSGKMVTG
jgi:heme a synthase